MTQVADLAAFEKFLQMCAGRCGQLLNLSELSNELGLTHQTTRQWVSNLEASHIVKLLQPWHANVGKRLVKTPKHYFIDTGLACHLLGIERFEQVRTHPLGGALLKNLILTEALKQRFDAGRTDNLFFHRDHSGNEVDLLLCHADGVSGYENQVQPHTPTRFLPWTRLHGGRLWRIAMTGDHLRRGRCPSGKKDAHRPLVGVPD